MRPSGTRKEKETDDGHTYGGAESHNLHESAFSFRIAKVVPSNRPRKILLTTRASASRTPKRSPNVCAAGTKMRSYISSTSVADVCVCPYGEFARRSCFPLRLRVCIARIGYNADSRRTGQMPIDEC
jgi:hypothetical protein